MIATRRLNSPLSLVLLALLATVAMPRMAQAACTSPAGEESQMIWDWTSHVMTLCNGSTWLTVGGGSSSGTAGYIQFSNGSGGFSNSGTTSGEQLFWDDTNKRLGIGTSSPSYPLHVETGVSGSTVIYGNATAATGINYGVWGKTASSGNNGAGVYGSATSSTALNYGVWGEAASSMGRGVYGIASSATGTTYGVYGTAASTSGRAVYGVTTASSGTNYGVYGQSPSTSGRGVYGTATASSGTNYGVYGQSGSSAGYGVYCSASFASGCGGNQAWTNTSDARLKREVRDVDAGMGLNTILKLRPVTFTWRTNNSGKVELGFIAQEVEKVLPEVVGRSPDAEIINDDGTKQEITDVKALSYASFVVPLVKAVQELKILFDRDHDEIAELKVANDNLKAAVDGLAREVEALKVHKGQ